ncbi:hypothetical protein TNCV_4650911 [Trichonephila clavipes]|nr:hypothetical protein TNCV_4650911 [Trichonephila clavipes]
MAFQTLRFLGHGSVFDNLCGDDALCSSEGQENFALSRLRPLLGFLFGSFTHCRGSQQDLRLTVRRQSRHMR